MAKKFPANPTLPTKAEAVENGEKFTDEYVEDLLATLDDTVGKLTEAAAYFEKVKADVDEEIRTMYEEIRSVLPEEEAAPTAVTKRSGGGRRASNNGTTIIDMARKVVKAAGRSGITRKDAAKRALELGYQSRAESDENFENSFYVSGLNKLLTFGEIEAVRTEGSREVHYRVKK